MREREREREREQQESERKEVLLFVCLNGTFYVNYAPFY